MIQNSLQRTIAGMAAGLRRSVAPHVADPYARSQALACAELLEGLAPRVEWRAGDLDGQIELVRPLLAATVALAPPDEATLERVRALAARAPGEADLEGARAAHVAALAQAQRWVAGHRDVEGAADLERRINDAVDRIMALEFERFGERARPT